MKRDTFFATGEVVKSSLMQHKTKQVLIREIVSFRPARNVQSALNEAGNRMAAGESLYLIQLKHHSEKARA